MYKFIMTRTHFEKKANTKTVWVEKQTETKEVSEKHYKNFTDPKAISFFRNLGGSETVERSYTCYGYVPTKIVSTSPDRETKIITKFVIDWVE